MIINNVGVGKVRNLSPPKLIKLATLVSSKKESYHVQFSAIHSKN